MKEKNEDLRPGVPPPAELPAPEPVDAEAVFNAWKDEPGLNILCVHPGWMRTNEGNREAPLLPWEHAKTLLDLFEAHRRVKDGNLFITYAGEAYPW